MDRCRILLTPLDKPAEIAAGYSAKGLKLLAGSSRVNPQLGFTRRQFVYELPKVQKGMSISGFQPKLQIVLAGDRFAVVDHQGEFILKPSPDEFPSLAQNEHATMVLMSRLGFQVPANGLLCFAPEQEHDQPEYAFAVRRFDRDRDGLSLHQEQLDGAMNIAEKYGKTGSDGRQYVSYQQIAEFLIKHVNDNLMFKVDLFRRVVYAWLLGNNDMHLRNFGLIHPRVGRPYLSPVYDFVSVAPYRDAFASGYLALPLLRCEEGDEDLAPGFKTQYGEYIGKDFMEFGKLIGLHERLVNKLFSDLREEAAIVEATYKASFMSERDIEQALGCYQHRLGLLKHISEPELEARSEG